MPNGFAFRHVQPHFNSEEWTAQGRVWSPLNFKTNYHPRKTQTFSMKTPGLQFRYAPKADQTLTPALLVSG